MAIQQLGLIKHRAKERIDAAKVFEKKIFPSYSENHHYLTNVNKVIKDLKKSKKELQDAHKEWQNQIANETDTTKKENEQRKLNSELNNTDGILGYINKINEVTDSLQEIVDEIIEYLGTFKDTQMVNSENQPATESSSSSTTTESSSPATIPKSSSSTAVPDHSNPANSNPASQSETSTKTVTFSDTAHYSYFPQYPNQPTPSAPPAYSHNYPQQQTVTKTDFYPQGIQFPASVPAPAYFPQYSTLSMSLPKLEMSKFSGDPRNFKLFWNTFSIIHNHPSLSKYEKLAHLLNNLTGPAKQMFQLYSTSAENYDIVVAKLHEKYGQDSHIIRALVAEFNSIKLRNESIEEAKRVITAYESIIEQLQALSFNVENEFIREPYEKNIPRWLLEKIYVNGEISTLREFRQKALMHIEIAIKIGNTQHHKTPVNYFSWNSSEDVSYPFSTDANDKSIENSSAKAQIQHQQLPTSASPTSNYDPLSCVFCGKHKYSSSCQTVTDVDERMKILSAKKLCYNCLKGNHISKKCTSKPFCKNCKGNHHTALCANEKEESIEKPVHSIKINVCQSKNETSMMVVNAPICHPDKQHIKSHAEIFFDSGAGASFIKSSLAEKLKLPIIKNETLRLSRFAENRESTSVQIQSNKVSVSIKTKDNKFIPISAYTIENLTDYLPHITSDGTKKATKPEILIGNDYCWSFIPSKKLSNGYSEVNTLLGKVICGQKTSPEKYDSEVSSAKAYISTHPPSNEEIELENRVTHLKQKMKDMEALFVSTENELLTEIHELKSNNSNLVAVQSDLQRKLCAEKDDKQELMKEVNFLKTEIKQLSNKTEKYRESLEEKLLLKADIDSLKATIQELKNENEKLKIEKTREISTNKSLRSLLTNVRNMYEEATDAVYAQEEEINELLKTNSRLFDEKNELAETVKNLQNEIENFKFVEPANQISLFYELREAQFEPDIIKEVPRGKPILEEPQPKSNSVSPPNFPLMHNSLTSNCESFGTISKIHSEIAPSEVFNEASFMKSSSLVAGRKLYAACINDFDNQDKNYKCHPPPVTSNTYEQASFHPQNSQKVKLKIDNFESTAKKYLDVHHCIEKCGTLVNRRELASNEDHAKIHPQSFHEITFLIKPPYNKEATICVNAVIFLAATVLSQQLLVRGSVREIPERNARKERKLPEIRSCALNPV